MGSMVTTENPLIPWGMVPGLLATRIRSILVLSSFMSLLSFSKKQMNCGLSLTLKLSIPQGIEESIWGLSQSLIPENSLFEPIFLNYHNNFEKEQSIIFFLSITVIKKFVIRNM